MMSEVLFDGMTKVSDDDAIQRMKGYRDRAKELMNLYEEDKRATVALARELRSEFREEYRNNRLQRIQRAYKDHEFFNGFYKHAIDDAYVKTTGQLTERKALSFLWDVQSYMSHYMPREHED